jgi:hypothetical protein
MVVSVSLARSLVRSDRQFVRHENRWRPSSGAAFRRLHDSILAHQTSPEFRDSGCDLLSKRNPTIPYVVFYFTVSLRYHRTTIVRVPSGSPTCRQRVALDR